jgi:hypothetical protein
MPFEILSIAEAYFIHFSETHEVVAGATTVLTHSILYLYTDGRNLALGDEISGSHRFQIFFL